MLNEKMLELGSERSVIRELHEQAVKMRAERGEDAVFDFTIGNPSVLPPQEVNESIVGLLSEEDVHAYTSSVGRPSVRRRIAENLNARYGAAYQADGILLTAGAAAALAVVCKALLQKGENAVLLAPYFPEYKVYVESAGATCKVVGFDEEDLSVDFAQLENAVDAHTALVIVNSPNNPTGVVYGEETLRKMAEILERKQRTYGHPIYLLSDEPYREIVFGDVVLPFVPRLYDNTVVCYSYSKTLSLPGERIGYVATLPQAEGYEKLCLAFAGAARANGFVCAPSLFQRVIERTDGKTADISVYEKNGNVLFEHLTAFGYRCYKPQGAFYLFVAVPDGDSNGFAERAKAEGLFVVPADSFGAKGFLRIATCVKEETVLAALPAFRRLAGR